MQRSLRPHLVLASLLAAGLGASSCADEETAPPPPENEPATALGPIAGSCDYTGNFTMLPECKEFVGEAWTEDNVVAECEAIGAEPRVGEACSTTYSLGTCTLEVAEDAYTRIHTYSEDPAVCEDMVLGCETFGGGTWEPYPICGGSGGGGGGGDVFIQPTLECRDPLDGEPAGAGPNGQVCTWQAISGCTEEGRHFADYASCDVVLTQRPYFPGPPAEGWDAPDARLDDPGYAAELAWVTSQVESSACVCCHSTDLAPDGPSNWYTDAPGNWVNTMNPSGLALGAGWINSEAFGAYPPEDNNGFARGEESGFPSTDPARMQAFFAGELAHRGFSQPDFADAPPFGGPLYDQIYHVPEACTPDQRIDADGTIHWTGGDARYLYVLAADAQSPTVPPNLDLPNGTLWRVDVPSDGSPIASGSVRYGELPTGTSQRFPEQGAPPTLEPGQAYYLYVARDVAVPITRCVLTR